jgi:hypothetical protein
MPLTRFVFVGLAGCLALTNIGEAAQTEDSWVSRQHAAAAIFRVSARQVDPALPDVGLLTWLQNVVGDDAKVFPGGYSNPCQNVPTEAAPPLGADAPWSLCALVTASLNDGREVAIALAASVIRDLSKPGDWKVLSVHLFAAYVVDTRPGARLRDSLDVPTLGDLPQALALSVANWPHAELRIRADDLRVEPPSFRPGDQVTVVVTVRNIGAESAHVRLSIHGVPECTDIGFALRELEGTVPAGQAVTWRSQITAPNFSRWILGASADLLPVAQMIRKYEVTKGSKGAFKAIGPPSGKKCGIPG